MLRRFFYKLYITPRQWMHVLRWTVYALLLLLTIMVQTVMIGRHTVFGAHPDFVSVVIVCVCLREGAARGGLFALLASLFWFLTGADTGSVSIFVLTALPVCASLVCRAYLTQRYLPCLLTCLVTLFVNHTAIFLIKLYLGQATAVMFLTRLLPCVFVSLIAQPIIYFLASRIEKIGEPYESA